MNERQRRFADEYIICGVAEEAAIKAGYSKNYARAQSHKLLANVGISEYLKNRMEELQDEKILTQKQVLVMLSEIASGQAKETIVVTTKVAELIPDPSTGKTVKVYNEVPQLVEYPTKNSDRNKALELLGKNYRLWTDKVEADVIVSESPKFDDIVNQLGGGGLEE
ncbi:MULTISPECIES: terminase small subunit [Streptococcus]|uniref:terminase small subunit n=1 Tax=Streptococcus TaxID=1301 RepID=UPI001E2CB2A5|nr:terminase small subunit [Streptococcus sp. zg-70]